MTTILGIVGNLNRGEIILASDVQRSSEYMAPVKDGARTVREKSPAKKIHYLTDSSAAIAIAGSVDKHYASFLNDFYNKKINLERAVKTGDFEELRKMNLDRNNRQTLSEGINGALLVAYEKGTPSLYRCDPLGLVSKILTFDTIGSGSEYVRSYVNAWELQNGIFNTNTRDVGENLVAARTLISAASQDAHTSGFDALIVTKNGFEYIGDAFNNSMRTAETSFFTEMAKKYKPKDDPNQMGFDWKT